MRCLLSAVCYLHPAISTGVSLHRTGYPVHVNARWCLTDNRRSLVADTAASNKARVTYNSLMLTDAVAGLWAELLLQLTDVSLPVSEYYGKWPCSERVRDPFWMAVIQPLCVWAVCIGYCLNDGQPLLIRASFDPFPEPIVFLPQP